MKSKLTCESCRLRLEREKYELKLALPTQVACPQQEGLCRYFQPERSKREDDE